MGGIPDMVRDGTDGLLYPVGDVTALADRIRNVFERDDVAISLGSEARNAALARHDPEAVVDQLLDAYGKVLQAASSHA